MARNNTRAKPVPALRNLSEMKNVPEMTDRLLPDPEDKGARTEFIDAVTVLIDSLDFHVNRPVWWNALRRVTPQTAHRPRARTSAGIDRRRGNMANPAGVTKRPDPSISPTPPFSENRST